jgi:hypothetical protein
MEGIQNRSPQNRSVTLIIMLKFGSYRVNLVMNKPTGLCFDWLPKMPFFSSCATLYAIHVEAGRKKRCTHIREAF